MVNYTTIFIILMSSIFTIAQNSEDVERLKKYKYYIEKNIYKSKTKNFLKKGIVLKYEYFYKNKLRSTSYIKYDTYGNIVRKITTSDDDPYVIDYKLVYKDSLLIKNSYETFSDFNSFGKPQLIETEQNYFSPYKTVLEYDKKGNVSKKTEYSTIEIETDEYVEEKGITYFTYDEYNNVIQIKREYFPKQQFPILMIGAPALYENEYYRYVYNEDGLWIRKYKRTTGEEYLVSKRKYKKGKFK